VWVLLGLPGLKQTRLRDGVQEARAERFLPRGHGEPDQRHQEKNSLNAVRDDCSAYYAPLPDTDGDGLADTFENQIGTNPNVPDTDGDGVTDFNELNRDGDPTDYTHGVDTDPGSSPNTGIDPLVADPKDTDGDSLSDKVETHTGAYVSPTDTGTNPLNPDTDGDSFSDGEEVAAATDPLDETSHPIIANGDVNGDGQVDVKDLLLAMRILTGQYTPSQEEQSRWDIAPLVNGVPAPDGQNNLGDYLILQRKVLGL
jgi:hypothetical protein